MQVEIRADKVILEGYVNAVERDSRVLPPSMARGAAGPFVERVRAGTFQRALERGENVELRFNHRRAVGSTAGGELRLYEDAVGLRARAEVADAEVVKAAKSGELTGWSFGFQTIRDEWEEAGDVRRRTLEEVELREVSILTQCPAYIATTVEVRGEDENIIELRSSGDRPEIQDNSAEDERQSAAQIMAGYKARRLKIGGKRE